MLVIEASAENQFVSEIAVLLLIYGVIRALHKKRRKEGMESDQYRKM